MPGPFPLTTLAPTINDYGISTVPFEDLLASLQQSYRNIYGGDIYLEPDSQDGAWLAIQCAAFYDLGQAIAAAYFAYSPSFATGIGLSSVVKINGLQRLTPTPSTVTVIVGGQAGTTITNGAVRDDFGNLWDLPTPLTIPIEGEITITATAREPGQILAAPGSVTTIATQVPGWQTVVNPTSAQPGIPVETDARLRRRQHRSTALPAITPIGGILGSLANLPGVGRVEIYENDTDVIDANGIPGHSIACVLEGGDAQQIAAAIALKKSPGCGTFGTTSVDVNDQAAQPNTINFFFTTEIEVFVDIVVRPRLGFLSATGDLIRQTVAQFISEIRHGWPVYREWLWTPASLAGDVATEVTGLSQFDLHRLAETYVVEDIRLGTSRAAMGIDDVIIHFAEASFATAADVAIIIQ